MIATVCKYYYLIIKAQDILNDIQNVTKSKIEYDMTISCEYFKEE